MMPILHAPGVMMPGQFGPMRRVRLVLRGTRRTLIMSITGMPSVMQMTSSQPASTASRIASAAPGGGTKMHARVGARRPSRLRSTVSKTGTLPSNFSPPRAGRDAGDDLACRTRCTAWRGTSPRSPVMPWTTTLACLCRRGCSWLTSRSDGGDDLLRAVGHRRRRPESRGRSRSRILRPSSTLVPFEAHDERHLEPELLRRGDDARRR